jgi:transcriptional regulator with XRE-family HTH domain
VPHPAHTDPGAAPAFERALALLGAKVAAVRHQRGYSQTELANLAGIQRKSLQNVEYARSSAKGADGSYGHGNPKLDTVFAIAGALDIDIAWLIDPNRPVTPLPRQDPRTTTISK